MIELFHSFERVLYHMLTFFQSFTEPLLGANSYWVAIVLMTLTVRAALLPLVVKQVRSARAMRALQPQLQALRERHGNNQAKLMEETTRLTREHGVNPLAGCLPLLAQAPVFIALSRVIWSPFIDGQPNVLRGHLTLGVDLGSSLSGMSWADRLGSPGGLLILSLIVIAAITTTLTQRLAMAQQPTPLPDAQRRLLQLMPLFFPLMWIRFPLAAIIYWVSSNLWTLGQQWVVTRTSPALPTLAPALAAAPAAPAKGTARGGGGATRTGKGQASATGAPVQSAKRKRPPSRKPAASQASTGTRPVADAATGNRSSGTKGSTKGSGKRKKRSSPGSATASARAGATTSATTSATRARRAAPSTSPPGGIAGTVAGGGAKRARASGGSANPSASTSPNGSPPPTAGATIGATAGATVNGRVAGAPGASKRAGRRGKRAVASPGGAREAGSDPSARDAAPANGAPAGSSRSGSGSGLGTAGAEARGVPGTPRSR